MSRPRLLDVLDTAVESTALTLVTAEPGGGKSVLLSEWAHCRPAAPAWLALSRADDDPVRFWRLFVAAVRPRGLQPLPTAWSAAGVPGLLDSLFGAQEGALPPALVVIDDAHLLTDREVLDGLDRLIQRWPARVRLVLGCRSAPPLPLHRYRLAGHVSELRAADLAMTMEEARALFVEHDVRLTDEEIGRVLARTEGWTGGLRLVAMRMEGSPSPARIVDELAVDQGSIGEYLIDEVLSALPEQVRRLLIETSFLDEISGEAAEAITGVEGAADVLAGLARTNSFVVPLDSSCARFRYHHLFGEVLRHLARRRPDRAAREADLRAMAWFRGNHDVAAAVQWALRTGDGRLARTVLARGGLGAAVVSARRLAGLPLDELVRVDRPGTGDAAASDHEERDAARAAVAALRLFRDNADGDPLADAPAGPEPTDPELRVTVRLARLLSAWAGGKHEHLGEAVDRLLAEDVADAVAAVPGLRAKVLLLQARAAFSAGHVREVEPRLLQALDAAEVEQAVEVELEILGVLAVATASAGRPHRTREALDRAADLILRHPHLVPPVTLDAALARDAYMRADLPAMAEAVRRALAAGPIYPDHELAASITYLRALLLSVTGRVNEARRWLQAPVLQGLELGPLAAYRDCELARIDVAAGRADRAFSRLRPYEKGPFALTVAVAAAQAALAAGDVRRAERALQPLISEPSFQVDRFLLVSAFLCRAEIALHRSDDGRALECVAQARELAGSDVVIPFVRATAALASLLARHPEAATGWPGGVPTPADKGDLASAPAGRLTEPLTEREQSVLWLLATAMPTAEIAGTLFVSANTVKTHVAAIYRKLGVTRRREAVQRARELELL